MGWMQKLYDTYEACQSLVGVREGEKQPLMPIYHTTQQAQVEAVIDTNGNWRGARVLADKNERTTLIPCTEKSAGVANGRAPHPLFDKLKYIASDYLNYRTPKVNEFPDYLEQLSGWCTSPFANPKVCAVLKYLKKGTLITDLIHSGVLYADAEGRLPESWAGPKENTPLIFKVCPNDQADAFVRFQVVQADGAEDANSRLWDDKTVWQSFINYQNSLPSNQDICYVLGKKIPVSTVSPKYIRNSKDLTKLISSNLDTKGYIVSRGRFETPEQAFCIGQETTEKAHAALKWLISKQAYVNGNQVILAWKTDGGPVIDPCRSSLETVFGWESKAANPDFNAPFGAPEPEPSPITTKEEFAARFRKALAGYGGNLEGWEDACILGLDSATEGRLSVFYYRELRAEDLVRRVKSWHETCSWLLHGFWPGSQNSEKPRPFPYEGAPAPKDIVKAAYGSRVDEKLSKSAVQRLLPCIVDGARLPEDLMRCAARRASNPVAAESESEARKTLETACALVRKYYNDRQNHPTIKDGKYKERWKMQLNPEEKDRSYLYGRLLAIAEVIEYSSYDTEEKKGKRQTNAERMMETFSQRPFTTWPLLYKKVLPYEGKIPIRLRNYYKKMIGNICDVIENADYQNNKALDGLFLLGYFCQRQVLFTKQTPTQNESEQTEDKGEEIE